MEPAVDQSGQWGCELKPITENGEIIYLVDGADEQGVPKVFGIPKIQLEAIRNRGSNVRLAQFLTIVCSGLVLAKHMFRGLKRRLCDGENMDADKEKLVYCWTPPFDCWWSDTGRFDPDKLEVRKAPEGRVFVVIVTPNSMKEEYPSVDYWIERWYWVRCSSSLPSAPIDYDKRYTKQLK